MALLHAADEPLLCAQYVAQQPQLIVFGTATRLSVLALDATVATILWSLRLDAAAERLATAAPLDGSDRLVIAVAGSDRAVHLLSAAVDE
jgi:hypothetical protein